MLKTTDPYLQFAQLLQEDHFALPEEFHTIVIETIEITTKFNTDAIISWIHRADTKTDICFFLKCLQPTNCCPFQTKKTTGTFGIEKNTSC